MHVLNFKSTATESYLYALIELSLNLQSNMRTHSQLLENVLKTTTKNFSHGIDGTLVFLNKKKMPVRKSLTDYHMTSNIFEAD